MQVAVVDYTATDAPEKFTRSLRETGFAVIVNHPLPWEMVETIYREWGALFDSPAIEKYRMDEDRPGGLVPARSQRDGQGQQRA